MIQQICPIRQSYALLHSPAGILILSEALLFIWLTASNSLILKALCLPLGRTTKSQVGINNKKKHQSTELGFIETMPQYSANGNSRSNGQHGVSRASSYSTQIREYRMATESAPCMFSNHYADRYWPLCQMLQPNPRKIHNMCDVCVQLCCKAYCITYQLLLH